MRSILLGSKTGAVQVSLWVRRRISGAQTRADANLRRRLLRHLWWLKTWHLTTLTTNSQNKTRFLNYPWKTWVPKITFPFVGPRLDHYLCIYHEILLNQVTKFYALTFNIKFGLNQCDWTLFNHFRLYLMAFSSDTVISKLTSENILLKK